MQSIYPSDTSAPPAVSAKKAAKGRDVHAFNLLVARHPELSAVAVLPVRDGLTLAIYDPAARRGRQP
jgi:predicted O-methyltransferase YrrM